MTSPQATVEECELFLAPIEKYRFLLKKRKTRLMSAEASGESPILGQYFFRVTKLPNEPLTLKMSATFEEDNDDWETRQVLAIREFVKIANTLLAFYNIDMESEIEKLRQDVVFQDCSSAEKYIYSGSFAHDIAIAFAQRFDDIRISLIAERHSRCEPLADCEQRMLIHECLS